MNVYRKNTVRWTLDGKRVSPSTAGATRQTIPSKRFYGTLRTFDGKRKQIPLSEDRQAATLLLRRLQTDEDRKRALGVDHYALERHRPLNELLDEYATFLRSKADTVGHIRDTLARIHSLLDVTKTKTWLDLDASRIAATLAGWRQRQQKPMGISTSNHYAVAIKAFSRWLWTERRTMDDPLRSLRPLNAAVDRRRIRRAFTPDELRRLIHAAQTSQRRLRGLTGEDRAMLYTLAVYTGLRASELASLTAASFNLEAKTVSVQAAYSKRRRNDTLPLHSFLVERLRLWLVNKSGKLFPGTWTKYHKAVGLLRSDLRSAGIAYRDEHGRYADFHALRHTFISSLAKNGVHPAKAKELARHSTITLTLDVYSHVAVDELRSALDSLPPL